MADFQPRFVDLVRSYTSTVGTGNFVLGPTVSGFAGFGSALQVGDNFYYSAIGVDKPGEREVGRGTLMAGGQITRQPLSGSPTNFSTGTKSIALIAPAEWFNAIQSSAGSAPAMAASRSALAGFASQQVPAILTERGREGLFVFDGSNLAAAVAGDPRQGVYVAPASAMTGASGAWVRRFDGPVCPEWFGATGNGTTDDQPAIQAAIDFQVAAGGGTVRFAAKRYRCGSTLTWSGAAIELRGSGSGVQSTGGTILAFPYGLAGAVNLRNGSAGLGAGSAIRNLRILGSAPAAPVTIAIASPAVVAWTGHGLMADQPIIFSTTGGLPAGVTAGTVYFVRNPTANSFELSATAGGTSIATSGSQSGSHWAGKTVTDANSDLGVGAGVLLQANGCHIEDVVVQGFEGNGFHVLSDVTSALNANNCIVTGLHCWNNLKNGFATKGDNSNRCTNTKLDCVGNFQFAIYENGFLGNTYLDPHAASNGSGLIRIGALSRANVFWNVYKEADSSAVALQIDAGGAGRNFIDLRQVEGTIVAPATLWITDNSGTGDNVYWRNGQYFNQLRVGTTNGSSGTLALDSTGLTASLGSAVRLSDNPLTAYWAFNCAAGNLNIASDQSGQVAFIIASAVQGAVTTSGYNVPSGKGYYCNGSLALDGVGKATLGASSTAKASLNLAHGVAPSSPLNGDIWTTTAGVFARINGATVGPFIQPSSAVTPTSVASAGSVTSSGGGMGYAAGAGGTVTQATSKSASVTLNKLCGQITMNAAALAAGTTVSFALANSNVAAGDLLILNHVAGGTAGSYALNAQCGSGTATINVRNISAGALSEAVVIAFAVQKAVTT